MLRTVFKSASSPFTWLDLVEPTRADMDQVARDYGLTATAVADCLDPEHLPKFERFNGSSFVILRGHDELAADDADTIQAFTRKVALFWSKDFLITIHRKDQPYLTSLMDEWAREKGAATNGDPLPQLLADLANAVIFSYELPLVKAEERLDGYEHSLFTEHDVARMLSDLYLIKRQVGLAKRLLWRTLSVTSRLGLGLEGKTAGLGQDLRENAESMHFYADELLEDVTNLLNMQLQLAAHRTNEVVQVLTIFSAFFLPLTFIVGVYGMNFTHMPELPEPWGYPAVWGVMIAVCVGIYVWFRRRRWL